MDENVDGKIHQFLKSLINPNDDDITDFVVSLATEDSSINIEELANTIKERSRLLGEQSDKLYKLEEDFSAFSDQDTPGIDEFKQILFSAYDKNSELVDVSEDIDKLSTIIENLKAGFTDEETLNEAEEAPDLDKLLERIQDLRALKDENLDREVREEEAPEKETTPEKEATSKKETTPEFGIHQEQNKCGASKGQCKEYENNSTHYQFLEIKYPGRFRAEGEIRDLLRQAYYYGNNKCNNHPQYGTN